MAMASETVWPLTRLLRFETYRCIAFGLVSRSMIYNMPLCGLFSIGTNDQM